MDMSHASVSKVHVLSLDPQAKSTATLQGARKDAASTRAAPWAAESSTCLRTRELDELLPWNALRVRESTAGRLRSFGLRA